MKITDRIITVFWLLTVTRLREFLDIVSLFLWSQWEVSAMILYQRWCKISVIFVILIHSFQIFVFNPIQSFLLHCKFNPLVSSSALYYCFYSSVCAFDFVVFFSLIPWCKDILWNNLIIILSEWCSLIVNIFFNFCF